MSKQRQSPAGAAADQGERDRGERNQGERDGDPRDDGERNEGERVGERNEGRPLEPLRDDEPAIIEATDELGGSGEVTPGDDNFPEPGRGRASDPGKPLRSP